MPKSLREQAYEILDQMMSEQATGCPGAGDYREWARRQGYPHLEVLNWSSSAGDWEFLVSKDGNQWVIMSQTNRWPRPGFDRHIDTSRVFHGTAQAAVAQIEEMWYVS